MSSDSLDPETEGESGRSFYNGDVADLVSALAKIQKTKGLNWIVYQDENPHPGKSKMIRDDVAPNLEVLKIIHDVQANLSFAPNKIKEIMEMITSTNKMKFAGPGPAMKQNWIDTMTIRWRNLCRNVQQQAIRKPPPHWIKKMLPWMVSGSVGDTQMEDSQATVAIDEDETQKDDGGDDCKKPDENLASKYTWKFCDELMRPLKQLIPISRKCKVAWEPGNLEIDGLEDDDHAIASWPDGMRMTLKQRVSDIKRLSRPGISGPSLHEIKDMWQGQMVGSKNQLRLGQRTDRFLLMSLWEQGKQVLQVNIKTFGPIPGPKGPNPPQERQSNDHPSVIAAFEFMKPIALLYKAGEVAREDLRPLRDKRLRDSGMPTSGKGRPSTKIIEKAPSIKIGKNSTENKLAPIKTNKDTSKQPSKKKGVEQTGGGKKDRDREEDREQNNDAGDDDDDNGEEPNEGEEEHDDEEEQEEEEEEEDETIEEENEEEENEEEDKPEDAEEEDQKDAVVKKKPSKNKPSKKKPSKPSSTEDLEATKVEKVQQIKKRPSASQGGPIIKRPSCSTASDRQAKARLAAVLQAIGPPIESSLDRVILFQERADAAKD